jgi:hypothetical protein
MAMDAGSSLGGAPGSRIGGHPVNERDARPVPARGRSRERQDRCTAEDHRLHPRAHDPSDVDLNALVKTIWRISD